MKEFLREQVGVKESLGRDEEGEGPWLLGPDCD